MLGLKTPPVAPPGFWSDQHGTRIQCVGHAHGADAIAVDGDPDARDFTATYSCRGQPIAALLVGRPHALPGPRRRIHDQTPTPQRNAARACSAGAIAVIDENTGEQIYP